MIKIKAYKRHLKLINASLCIGFFMGLPFTVYKFKEIIVRLCLSDELSYTYQDYDVLYIFIPFLTAILAKAIAHTCLSFECPKCKCRMRIFTGNYYFYKCYRCGYKINTKILTPKARKGHDNTGDGGI
jgi:tRNA(Ile2) C34 agmatinyltransferase TiaS